MSLDGLPRVLANLNRAITAMQTTAASAAVERLANDAAHDMRGTAPVGESNELRTSISVSGTGAEREITAADHWIYPEFGTRHMDAKPFARPALHKIRQRYGDVVRQEFKSKVPHLQ